MFVGACRSFRTEPRGTHTHTHPHTHTHTHTHTPNGKSAEVAYRSSFEYAWPEHQGTIQSAFHNGRTTYSATRSIGREKPSAPRAQLASPSFFLPPLTEHGLLLKYMVI